MAAGVYDFTLEQGATFRRTITWEAADDPVDLTGCTARAHFRIRYSDTTPILAMTTENGRIALGGEEGTIDLYISDEDTALLTDKKMLWDLEIVHPSGEVTRFLKGKVTLDYEVTK